MHLFQKEDFHPCCGFSLNSIVPTFVPILQVTLIKGGMVLLAYGMNKQWDTWMKDRLENPVNYNVRLICWIMYILHALATDLLAILLWRACRSRRVALIRIWLILSLVLFIQVMLTMFLNISLQWQQNHKRTQQSFVITFGYGFTELYLCFVVYHYMRELELDILMSSQYRHLTAEEIREFEDGICTSFTLTKLHGSTKSLVEQMQFQKWQREEFEIDRDRLQMDWSNPLGSGQYGKVLKAELQDLNSEGTLVAVKTVLAESVDVVCFKALLTELKVLSYIGSRPHPNVVKFIGACTANIEHRQLLLVSEFCALGSLNNYLRGSRALFRNFVRNGKIISSDHSNLTPEDITTFDLLKWGLEIAKGMDYLSKLRVVHGDLAARNVLLTVDKVAKITDFGLARQLYQYSVYVKTRGSLLPFRWLSLEALTDMNFSTQSDIWSYAVTLWELFSLGELPYGHLPFTLDFVNNLKGGLRPGRPNNTPDVMWDLMQLCWQAEPKRRPSFESIVKYMENETTLA